jgi:hypothetical protein
MDSSSFTLEKMREAYIRRKLNERTQPTVSVNNTNSGSQNAFHDLIAEQYHIWDEELGLSPNTENNNDPAMAVPQQQQQNHTMSPAVRAILEATAKGVPVSFEDPVMAVALAAARGLNVKK